MGEINKANAGMKPARVYRASVGGRKGSDPSAPTRAIRAAAQMPPQELSKTSHGVTAQFEGQDNDNMSTLMARAYQLHSLRQVAGFASQEILKILGNPNFFPGGHNDLVSAVRETSARPKTHVLVSNKRVLDHFKGEKVKSDNAILSLATKEGSEILGAPLNWELVPV